jgi:hypothetical protein
LAPRSASVFADVPPELEQVPGTANDVVEESSISMTGTPLAVSPPIWTDCAVATGPHR